MATLIITEKPSVAKNIADAFNIKGKKEGYYEGHGFIITWAFGHLLQLYDAKDYDPKMKTWQLDHFPFIPSQFKYKVKSDLKNRDKQDYRAKQQLQIIYKLMNRTDVEKIISATDYDREGQIIGDTIIYHGKSNKSIYRMLLNEWTPDEIKKGLQQIRPNEQMKPLQDAGICRQWTDWLIGINLTSVATLKFQKGAGKALNIGRVLLPTLKIIYDRDKEIETFVPENYFKLAATFRTKTGEEYVGTYFVDKNDKFKTKEELALVQQFLTQQFGTIIDKLVEKKREFPPYLFNLSNLQGYITQKYNGFTADKVLKIAQSLYEKKYITYPRTASVVLEESLKEKAKKVLAVHAKGLPYEQDIKFHTSKRVFDNAKVDSHSAIMPTYLKPNKLSKDEQLVYQAIKNRFIMQFMPPAQVEETKLITKINNEKLQGIFVTKGKVQLEAGWKKAEQITTKDTYLPNVQKNEQVAVINSKITDHVTKPPEHHTEKTLLKKMETCGRGHKEEDSDELMTAILSGYSIGTPATRAETIKKLKEIGYIASDKKYLVSTPLGRKLVETFPIKELFDLEFTGRLEKALADIEKQKYTKQQFLSFIINFTKQSVETLKQSDNIIIQEIATTERKKEILGKCPLCRSPIIEGNKGYGCSNWKAGCNFVIWKNDKFLQTMKKKPTKTMVKTLLKHNRVLVKGLTSKKGNKFDAYLSYEKNADNGYFSWKIEFTT